jgi:hypothetical protein
MSLAEATGRSLPVRMRILEEDKEILKKDRRLLGVTVKL